MCQRHNGLRPHPLPVTTAFIKEGLGKLRVVAGESDEAHKEVTLYRGMQGVTVQDAFLREGGTELAPMSTTRSLKVAMQYGASENSVLLRVFTTNFMVRGPGISFLSAFPAEEEFLFPPLTYLSPTGETQKLRIDDGTFLVVDVRPQT